MAAGVRSPGEAFLAVTAADERPFLGDTAFASWLAGLTGGEQPLVALRDGALSLTAAGEEVHAGRADRCVLGVPVDRWHGGVHLSGRGPCGAGTRGPGASSRADGTAPRRGSSPARALR